MMILPAILIRQYHSSQTTMSSPIVFHPKTVHPKTNHQNTPLPSEPAYHHKANHNQNRSIDQSGAVATSTSNGTPKLALYHLAAPRHWWDSERIITEPTYEGYQVANDYDGADLVVVNTCGFIESAVQESLDAIGEAINKMAK